MNTIRGFIQAQSLSLIALLATFVTLFAFAYLCTPSDTVTKAIGTVETLAVGFIIYKQGRELRQNDQQNADQKLQVSDLKLQVSDQKREIENNQNTTNGSSNS